MYTNNVLESSPQSFSSIRRSSFDNNNTGALTRQTLCAFWAYFPNRLNVAIRIFMRALMFAYISHDDLVANTLISTTQGFLSMIAAGISVGMNLVLGDIFSSQPQEVGKIILQASIFITVTHIPLIGLMLASPYFWGWLGAPTAAVAIMAAYANVAAASLPLNAFLMLARHFFLKVERHGIQTFISLSGLALLGLLGYIFSFGLGAFPALGSVGFAWATLAQGVFSLAAVGAYLVFQKKLRQDYGLFSLEVKASKHYFAMLAKRSWLPILQFSLEWVILILESVIVSALGANVLAALGIASQYETLSLILGSSAMQAIASMVGEKNQTAVNRRRLSWIGMILFVGASVFLNIGMCIPWLQTFMVALFVAPSSSHYQEVLELFKPVMLCFAIGQVFDTWRYVANGVLMAKKEHPIISLLLNIIPMTVGFGISCALRYTTVWMLSGVALGGSIGIALAAALVGARMIVRLRQSSAEEAEAKPLLEDHSPAAIACCCRFFSKSTLVVASPERAFVDTMPDSVVARA